jgi:hypothetical protein
MTRDEWIRLTLLVVAGCMLVSLTARAQVFPPKVGSEYIFSFLQECPALDADGVALTPPGLSVSFHNAAAPAAMIACTDVPTCGVPMQVSISVSDTGTREEFFATAWSQIECVGDQSERSADTAYTWPGVGPRKPKLQ